MERAKIKVVELRREGLSGAPHGMPSLSGWLFLSAGTLYGGAALISLWVLITRRKQVVAWIPRIVLLGMILHLAAFVARTLGYEAPWSLSSREILFLLAFAGISAYLLAHFRYRLEVMGIIILPLVVALMAVSLLMPEEQGAMARQWQISLRAVHVVPAVLGVAFLFITFTTSLIYLIQERGLKEHRPRRFALALPSLERCDRLSYISLGWGFAFLTFVVVTGALTTKYTQGDLSWMMRERFSLLAWALFAVVIYDRIFGRRWRGKLSAYLSIIGFVAIIMRMVGMGT
jgi:ABC-type uncharacterized transport system permease subunit